MVRVLGASPLLRILTLLTWAGVPYGVTLWLAADSCDHPSALWAATVNEYDLPLVSPVIVTFPALVVVTGFGPPLTRYWSIVLPLSAGALIVTVARPSVALAFVGA